MIFFERWICGHGIIVKAIEMMTRDNWNLKYVKYILYYKLKYIILLFDMYYINLKLYYIESIQKMLNTKFFYPYFLSVV